MTRRSTAVALLASLILAGAITVTNADGRHDNDGTLEATYRGRSAAEWAAQYRRRTRQLQAVRAFLQRRWRPTVTYALKLASAVSGVAYSELRAVSWCESRHYVYARNGQYLGLFQMHWRPFGFSPFDPVASALSAAFTVRHDGGWRQWECKP